MIAEFPAKQWKQRTFFRHERTFEQQFFGDHVNINK